ncbi:MAG: hypothetical protein WB992_20455 [Bryobacteraceae bacterium]
MLSDLYLSSAGEKPPLRIGVLLDTPVLAAAFASVLADVKRSDFARLELVVYNASAIPSDPPPHPHSRWATLSSMIRNRDRRDAFAWALYSKLDQRFSSLENDPLAEVDCAELLEGVEALHVTPITKRFVHRFPEESLGLIRAKRLDVLLRFGFNILRGDVLNAARYGVWSFHHGDNDYYRGGPAHFWEMHEHSPLSGVILQVLTEQLDSGIVLMKGLFATESGMSLKRNRVQPYWGSAHFVIAKLWELHRFGWEHVEARIIPSAGYFGKRKIYRRPANADVIRWAVPQILKRTGRRAWARVARNDDAGHWQMAVRVAPWSPLCETEQPDMRGFRWIESPPDHFYADPFLIENEGKHCVFFEDYTYSSARGVIACAELSEQGTIGQVRLALDTGKHVSYPYIVCDHGLIYMIPETLQSQAVHLYRCVKFPDEWKLEAELFRGPVVDTSVCKHDGLWWFFITLIEPRGRAIGLYLFFSETLTGAWQYHPANPISLDVRNARGAGMIEQCGGKLIRPSQDSSRRYGYAVNFSEILKMTPYEYQEQPIMTIGPTWNRNLLAMHTYNRVGRFEVIDGLTSRRTKSPAR